MYTTKRFGLKVGIAEGEAKSIARPVARLVQRRANIRRDLDDAADGAGALAGFVMYLERVAAGAGSDTPQRPVVTRPSPAPTPAPEPARAPAHERVESFVASEGGPAQAEPGSGAFRETFLSGFDEIRPHE